MGRHLGNLSPVVQQTTNFKYLTNGVVGYDRAKHKVSMLAPHVQLLKRYHPKTKVKMKQPPMRHVRNEQENRGNNARHMFSKVTNERTLLECICCSAAPFPQLVSLASYKTSSLKTSRCLQNELQSISRYSAGISD